MKKRTMNFMLSTVLAMSVCMTGFPVTPVSATETVTLQEETEADDLNESVSENDAEESLSANSAADLPQDMVTPITITADQLVAVDCMTAGTKNYYSFTKTAAAVANGITISSASGGSSSYPQIKIYEVSGNQKTLKKTWSDSYSKGVYFPFENGKTYELEAGMWSSTGTGTYNFRIINGAKPTAIEFSVPKTTVKMGEVLPVTSSITLDDDSLQYKYDVVSTTFKGNWNRRSNLFSSGYRYLRPLEVGTHSVTASMRDFPEIKETITLEVQPPTINGEMKQGDTKNVKMDGKGFFVYSFVPEADDAYVFESLGIDGKNYDTYGYIFDKDFKQIASNDDGGEGSNFSVTKELKKGETYYLATRLYSESTTSEYSFNINLRGTETEVKVPVVIPVKPSDNSVYIGAMNMDYKKLTLAKGRSFHLTLYTDPPVFDSTITWESSRPKVATVNQKGVVRAKMPGKSAVITATTSEGLVASCVVKVPKVEVKSTGVTVKKNEVTLSVGKTSKIKAKMKPGNTTDNVTYKSKNPKVATVSSKGTITAVKKGKTKITVKTTSGKKAVVTVIVK